MIRALLVIVAACSPAATTPTPAMRGAHPPGTPVPAKPIRAVDTRVVELVADEAMAILVGPWLVTTVNPGGVEMLISPSGHCDDGTWFDYSGGGVAVPEAETLCVRSQRAHAVGFSGHAPPP